MNTESNQRHFEEHDEHYRIISQMVSDFTVYCDVNAAGQASTRWTIGAHVMKSRPKSTR